MKKLLSFLALALCFVACQNESVEVVSNGDLADVVLTIDAPELGVTRADGDTNAAKNSAYGAIDFFDGADWDTYDLRYILEVYDENEDGTGTPIYRERMVNCLDEYAPTTFALRLVPNRTYKFVVFADFVAEGNAELTEPADKLAIKDLYYNTADLRDVTAITTTVNPDTKVAKWGAMNEARDAYFVTENVEINNSLTKELTLTRPFAKLRVIATDLDYIANYSKPGYVEVAYTEKVFKSFNAVNGNLNAAEMTGNELAYGFEVKKDEPYTAGYDAETTNQTLFTDYLLAVEGEQTPVNFTIAVYEDAAKTRKIHEHNFNTQIPIQRNHLTTLIGDILTTQANIQIKIDDNFADEFVIGVGDDNTTTINTWNAGQLNANGDYTFVVEGENNFKVTVNGASVANQKLATGDYVLAEDAEKDENGNIVAGQNTFTVEALQANETTRALVDVEVIGGKMNVQAVDDNYKITLDLVLQFAEEKDVRHAIYTYEGTVTFGEVLDTPKVEATVKGNVVTLTWTAVADAKKYTITGFTEEPVVVTDKTTYEFTGEYETKYTYSVVASNDTLYSQPYNGTVTTDAKPVVEPEEPTALATPVVNASVKDNVVTLTWATVENAGSYKVFIGDEKDGISETVTPEEGATEVTFVKADLDYATTYTFTVYAIPADDTQFATSEGGTATATTGAEPSTEPEQPAKVTVAEFIDKTIGDTKYELTGEILSIDNKDKGRFYLKDDTGNILVYGLDLGESDIDWTGESNLNIGDTITIIGTRGEYNGTAQVNGAVYVSHVDGEVPVVPAQKVTVAQFLEAAEDAIAKYELTGTITGMYQNTANDDLYGNFYLTDDTGTVLIYGLYSPEGDEKYWEASGAKVGDDITVQTIRTSHSNTPQGKNAIFVALTSPGTRAFWSFSKTATTFAAAGGEQTIDVEAYNLTDAVSVASDNAQFTANYADGKLTITALENTTSETIDGNITVTSGALVQVITVSQAKSQNAGEVTLGEEYAYTFESTQFSKYNEPVTLGNLNWTASTTSSNAFLGWDSNNGKGQQFGSGSYPCKDLKISTSDYIDGIKKIVINTSGASKINAECTITIGGTQIGDTITLTSTATDYTFESDNMLSGDIVISYTQTTSKAIYIKSIKINPAE